MDREEMHRRFQKWESEVLSPYLDRVQTREHAQFLLDAGPEVRPVYTPLDAEKANDRYFQDLGLPGEYPFTRGISPDGPRSNPPLIKFYSGLGAPEDTNRRYKKLLSWGVEMIQIASDLPSQVGYDADHIMAAGEVGRAGGNQELNVDGKGKSRFGAAGRDCSDGHPSQSREVARD